MTHERHDAHIININQERNNRQAIPSAYLLVIVWCVDDLFKSELYLGEVRC